MNAQQDTEQRFIDLEIKISFMEDQVDALNQTVVQQQRQIDMLIREVSNLLQVGENAPGTFRNLRDELPPHY